MKGVTAYTTKEAADALAVSTSSIRKYASALEGAGHSFAKTESGARLITEMDLKTLLRMKKLISSGKSYLQAAEEAAKSAKVTEMIVKSVEEPNEVEELKQLVVQLVSEVGSLRSEIKELTHNQKHLLEELSQNRNIAVETEATEMTANVETMKIADDPQNPVLIRPELEDHAVKTEVTKKGLVDRTEISKPNKKSFLKRLFGKQ